MSHVFPDDPPGLPPCVLQRKPRLTDKQWESLLRDDADARLSTHRARVTIMQSAFNQVVGQGGGIKLPKKYEGTEDGSFLARVNWVAENADLSKPEAWQRPWTDAQIAEFKKAGQQYSTNLSFGEQVVQAIERALRKGDWEFVKRLAEMNIGIQKRKRRPRGILQYEPRNVLLVRNWVRFHDIDQKLPGIAWFRKAAANRETDNGLQIINALLGVNKIDPLTPMRVEKVTAELHLRPIRSYSLTHLPTPLWATSILQALK